MAFLFKPMKVFYLDADGKRVPKETAGAKKVTEKTSKWYGKGSPLPNGKKVPLAADKRAALQMLAELERKLERGETAIGGAEVEAARRPLKDHLADFAIDLKAQGVTQKQVGQKVNRIRRILEGCQAEVMADLDASKLQRYLADIRENGRPIPSLDPTKEAFRQRELCAMFGVTPSAIASLVRRHRLAATGQGKARRFPRETVEALRERLSRPASVQTSNHYLASIRSFTRWLVQRGRLVRDPLMILRPGNVKKDLRHDRRALKLGELQVLFQATGQNGETFRGLTGMDRLALYLTACGTGFRAGELAALTPASFALDAQPATVALPAREDKAGRSVSQPLPAGLVEVLRDYLKGKARRTPVWPGTWHDRSAEMLRSDLDAAGIPYTVEGPDGPLYADFHSLRHSFVALLDQAGVSLKQAMQLARHSDPKLTMARYGRAAMAELGAAVERISGLTAAAPLALPAPRPSALGLLDDQPPEVLKALAALGLAALAAGWFGET
jgi:integrase